LNLLNSLRTIGKNLIKGHVVNEAELLKALNKTLIQIRYIKSRYIKKKSPERENIIELLNEALNLYIEGIEDIAGYIKNRDKNSLSHGLFKAEEADDILSNVEDIIMQNKELFKDLSMT